MNENEKVGGAHEGAVEGRQVDDWAETLQELWSLLGPLGQGMDVPALDDEALWGVPDGLDLPPRLDLVFQMAERLHSVEAENTKSVEGVPGPAQAVIAIRALGRALDNARALDKELASAVNHARSLDRAVDRAVDRYLARAARRAVGRDFDRHLDQAIARRLEGAFLGFLDEVLGLGFARDMARALDQVDLLPDRRIALDDALDDARVRASALDQALDDARVRASTLDQALRQARGFFPNFDLDRWTRSWTALREFAKGRVDASRADLRHADVTDLSLWTDVVWSDDTLWPPGTKQRILSRSRELQPGVYLLQGGNEHRAIQPA